MTTHLLIEDKDVPGLAAACHKEEEGDRGITLEQANDVSMMMHFDCVECHKVLTGGSKHTTLEEVRKREA